MTTFEEVTDVPKPKPRFRRVKVNSEQPPKERRKRLYELVMEKADQEDVAPIWITRGVVAVLVTIVVGLATAIPLYYAYKAYTVSQTVKACVDNGKTWQLASNTKHYECR